MSTIRSHNHSSKYSGITHRSGPNCWMCALMCFDCEIYGIEKRLLLKWWCSRRVCAHMLTLHARAHTHTQPHVEYLFITWCHFIDITGTTQNVIYVHDKNTIRIRQTGANFGGRKARQKEQAIDAARAEAAERRTGVERTWTDIE